MAKVKTGEEGQVESSEVVESAPKKAKVVNLVTLASGKVKNFGEKGKLLSETTFTKDENGVTNGFSITFATVEGTEHTYTFAGDMNLLFEAAAFGFASKAKSATAGSNGADLIKVINDKIAEFNNGLFVTRSGGETTSAITQLQQAYAVVNGLGYESNEDVIKLNAIFSAMTKEDKAALYKVPKVKLALVRIQLAAAEAAAIAAGEEV